MKSFYQRAKAIIHREIQQVKGSEFDNYLEEANAFVERMKRFIDVDK